MKMILADCHTHSTNSPDGYNAPEGMILRALELGLDVYALTDHCEVNRWFSRDHYGENSNPEDTYDFSHDFECSMRDNMRLKEKYDGKLTFINGIELGQAQFNPGLASAVAEDVRLDFVIGSVHQVRGFDDFAFTDYSKVSAQLLVDRYYEEIREICEIGCFDVLGHITYPLRYIEGNWGISVNMERNTELILESMKLLIEKGKGIEINTSGLRQEYGKTFPDIDLVRLYRQAGGEIITVGSDAHRADDLGKGIAEGIDIAKAAGFEHIAYFIERKPHFIKI